MYGSTLKSTCMAQTAWKVSKYGVFFGTNTGKYGTEKNPYLDTYHTVSKTMSSLGLKVWGILPTES